MNIDKLTLSKFEELVTRVEEINETPPVTDMNIPLSTEQARGIIDQYQSIISKQAEEIANLKQQLEDYEHGHNAEMEGMDETC